MKKTRIKFRICLIAFLAIYFSSCDSIGKEEYSFDGTTIYHDDDLGVPDLSGWDLKEVTPSGDWIEYYFEGGIHGKFEKYKVSSDLEEFICYGIVPDSILFDLMRNRAEKWILQINSLKISKTKEFFGGPNFYSEKGDTSKIRSLED